ncbi:hypothetical protein ACS0TY_020091 [Phlomoides rotata]
MESGGGSGGGRRWIWCSEAPWKTNRGIAVARPYHGRRTEAALYVQRKTTVFA